MVDADSTFGYFQSDVLPEYMIRFASLAKDCMADHEDIPLGKDVLLELEAICQSCLVDEDAASASRSDRVFDVDPGWTVVDHQLCDRCQSFPAMRRDGTCRMCWNAEQQRCEILDMRHEVFRQLQRLCIDSTAAGAKLNTILDDIQTANLSNQADTRVVKSIPQLFFIVPAEQNKCWLLPTIPTKYYLYFMCEHTKCPINAPIKMHMTSSWIQHVAPIVAVSLHLLRSVLGLFGLQVTLHETNFQLTEGAVDAMLAEVVASVRDAGLHSELLDRLEDSTSAFELTDVPDLRSVVYNHLVEAAFEQREWRQLMELVHTTANSTA